MRERLSALERRSLRERADCLEDGAMLGEVNWGQAIEGSPPRSTASYRVVDKPFEQYLRRLRRLGDGLPLIEQPQETQARKKTENRRLRNVLLR